jgi:GTP-binding protein LepA
VDLPAANVEETKKQITEVLGVDADECLLVSAKTGLGVEDLLEAIVARIPAPKSDSAHGVTRALVFDSVFDSYRGVVTYVRVMDGKLKAGDRIRKSRKLACLRRSRGRWKCSARGKSDTSLGP